MGVLSWGPKNNASKKRGLVKTGSAGGVNARA